MIFDMKNKYEVDPILAAFSLQRSSEPCAALEALQQQHTPANALTDEHLLDSCRKRLLQEGDFWNEEELKMQFLALLFHVTQINEPHKIKTFYERPLSAVMQGARWSVVCDMLLAKPLGIGTPQVPYFFLQEFKKAQNAPNAEGQMLTAMLIAQHKNINNKPIYCCYIQGKAWTFASLHQRHYCLSRLYDATQTDDLATIVRMLLGLKQLILDTYFF